MISFSDYTQNNQLRNTLVSNVILAKTGCR